MQGLAMAICAAASVGLVATAANAAGQKMVEIDKAGNVRTSTGRDIGKVKQPLAKPQDKQPPAEPSTSVDICAPGYTWSAEGVAPEMATRARDFYRDVTQPYEREATKAREGGASLSRAREAEYWKAYGEFMKAVPQSERKIVELGVSPRLPRYCNALPAVPNAAPPSAPASPQAPPPPP
jgi:hypothetical protein